MSNHTQKKPPSPLPPPLVELYAPVNPSPGEVWIKAAIAATVAAMRNGGTPSEATQEGSQVADLLTKEYIHRCR